MVELEEQASPAVRKKMQRRTLLRPGRHEQVMESAQIQAFRALSKQKDIAKKESAWSSSGAILRAWAREIDKQSGTGTCP